jgi:hypothetical protein
MPTFPPVLSVPLPDPSPVEELKGAVLAVGYVEDDAEELDEPALVMGRIKDDAEEASVDRLGLDPVEGSVRLACVVEVAGSGGMSNSSSGQR